MSEKKTAGAFDIRNFIGALIGIYGVILVLAGFFADPEEAKTGGVNANLWAGIALIAVSAAFLTWARMKPTVVPDDVGRAHDDETRPATRHNRPEQH